MSLYIPSEVHTLLYYALCFSLFQYPGKIILHSYFLVIYPCKLKVTLNQKEKKTFSTAILSKIKINVQFNSKQITISLTQYLNIDEEPRVLVRVGGPCLSPTRFGMSFFFFFKEPGTFCMECLTTEISNQWVLEGAGAKNSSKNLFYSS